MSTGSYICDLNGILLSDLVARVQIGTSEITVIDGTSNFDAEYWLMLAQDVGGRISVVIEEKFTDLKQALKEFVILVQSEAGIDLETAE